MSRDSIEMVERLGNVTRGPIGMEGPTTLKVKWRRLGARENIVGSKAVRSTEVSARIHKSVKAGRAETEKGCKNLFHWSECVVSKDKDLIRCERSRSCC
jgi:hypothetical protein